MCALAAAPEQSVALLWPQEHLSHIRPVTRSVTLPSPWSVTAADKAGSKLRTRRTWTVSVARMDGLP